MAHQRHYVGYTDDLARRIEQHRAGEGAEFLKRANEQGITWMVVRVWMDADRDKEKSVKGMSARIVCPVCKAKAGELARHNKRKQQVSRSALSVSEVSEAA